MALSLAEIRAKLQAQAVKEKGGRGTGGQDNTIYPFWNNPQDSTASIRFLPDGDNNNDFFWVEKLMIKLPFMGIKGQSQKPTDVQVPCMDMWTPNSCPINAEIRPWWKAGKDMEDLARKYWRKKSFIFQGFVVQNPNKEDVENAPENPIRRFAITPSVFDRIKTVFLDQEVENNPIDYELGLDFRLIKSKKGDYADYGTSSWARRERALTDEELAAIQTHGLFNLAQTLPKKPEAAQLEAIMSMFQDSVDEKPYDPEKYAQFYKPYGLQLGKEGSSSDSDETVAPVKAYTPMERKTVVAQPRAVVEDDDVPFDVQPKARPQVREEVREEVHHAPAGEAKKASNPEDILAALRRRQQANKAQ
jgi:hypothetical protein